MGFLSKCLTFTSQVIQSSCVLYFTFNYIGEFVMVSETINFGVPRKNLNVVVVSGAFNGTNIIV